MRCDDLVALAMVKIQILHILLISVVMISFKPQWRVG
jgi:hypothetical protein